MTRIIFFRTKRNCSKIGKFSSFILKKLLNLLQNAPILNEAKIIQIFMQLKRVRGPIKTYLIGIKKILSFQIKSKKFGGFENSLIFVK